MRQSLALQGETVPAPELPDGLAWVWRAWHRLSADRPWHGGGMGPAVPGAIAWRDVRQWCEFHATPGEDVMTLDALIRAMDTEYFEWHAARAKAAAK